MRVNKNKEKEMKMRKIKKFFTACLIAVFGIALGIGIAIMPKTTTTANAALPTEYSVVETTFMVRLEPCYDPNGNFYLALTMPDVGTTMAQENVQFNTELAGTDLPGVFNSFGFFEKVKIGNKTLKELGCTTFFDNAYDINVGEPLGRIRLHCHADPTVWNQAIADGEVVHGQSSVTIMEGAMIPGYTYLTAGENPVVYKAGCDYVTEIGNYNYGLITYGKTEVESVVYVQDNKDGTGYFGISLKGDDYAGDGNQTEVNQNYRYNNYTNTILINGEAGKTGTYGLYNLGSKGQGYYSFYIRASKDDMNSITIPAGTLFPSWAMNSLPGKNNGNLIYVLYQTQTDITFTRSIGGIWTSETLVEKEVDVTGVNAFYGDGVGDDYFVNIEITPNDFSGLNTYGGEAYNASQLLRELNFYDKILVNDAKLKTRSEVFINVWGVQNVLSIRAEEDYNLATSINKITILAGCQIPTYKILSTGALELFVTKTDVTFVKVSELNWVNVDGYTDGKIIEIENYKKGEFRQAEEEIRLQAVQTAIETINSATTVAEVDQAVATAKATIDGLKTNLEYTNEELAVAKQIAKEEIQAYNTSVNQILRGIEVEKAIKAIDAVTTAEGIEVVVESAKKAIDDVVNAEFIDTAVFTTITSMSAEHGTLNFFLTIPGLEVPTASGSVPVDGLQEILVALGFFNNVSIKDKTLTEWGFALFEESVSYNLTAPFPTVYFALVTNSQEYKDAATNGDISFTKYEGGVPVAFMSSVTVAKDTIIPSYSYLTEGKYTLYRVTTDYVSQGMALPYDIQSTGKVEVGEGAYVQDNGDGTGYFGLELIGSDYPSLDEHVEASANYYYDNDYSVSILVNGESAKVTKYALFALGVKGQNKLSFAVTVSEADMYSITIPAGTVFPSYASNILPAGNSGNSVYILYEVQTTVTLVKNAEGNWVNVETYRAEKITEIDNIRAGKTGEYFTADITAMDNAVAEAKNVINNSTSVSEIEQAIATAKTVIDGVEDKATTITNAKAEIEGYKAEQFREAEEAQRVTAIETAKNAIDNATSKDEVTIAIETAKATIDALKTADEYAKEEIANEKASAKAELEGYKAEEGYFRAEETALRQTAIDTAITAIDDAVTVEEINNAVATAKATIDALKTAADYDKEESLENAKATALEAVNTANANVEFDKYTEENQTVINTLYANARTAIENATTEEEVATAVATFTTELAKVPQIGQTSESGSTEGCMSGINGLSAIFGLLILLASAVTLRKKNQY